jgi:LysM repeat protein
VTEADDEEVCNPKANSAVAAGFYTIKEGDLLSLIAERTCLREEDLLRLNPGIDPQALTPGSCVALEEGGCESDEEPAVQ